MDNKTDVTKETLPVLNMYCAACANSVQKILTRQPGVCNANVNFATETAQIEYDSAQTDTAKLKAALQAVGYDLNIEKNDHTQEDVEAQHQKLYQDLKKKVIGSAIFAIPLVIIAMTPSLMHLKYANYVMWLLASPIVLYFGKDYFVRGFKQLLHKEFSMDTLVSLSAGTAYIYSIFNTLFPGFWLERGLHPDVYFEAAGVVITFVLFGKLLEEKAKTNTSSSLKKLIGLQPKTVLLVNASGETTETPISAVKKDDLILVKPGEKIAVDGIVTNGSSYVDESMITGEPIAVEKKTGNKVYAGTINQRGSFTFQAQSVGASTLLSQIIKMVQDAQGSKAPVQKMVDKIAGIFVPVVITIAVISFIIWMILGQDNAFTHAILAFVTVLVVACPCALGLATPTAIMVGIGKGAENGILIKDAESLETIQHVNAVMLDKTGTITEGKPKVVDIRWNSDENDVLRNILYSIEYQSEHPLAAAIADYFKDKAQIINNIHIESLTGKGISATVDDKIYTIGNEPLIESLNISYDADLKKWSDQKLDDANTLVLFADNKSVLCSIAIADQIKPTSIEAVQELKNLGVEVYMLTGDNEKTAEKISRLTNIDYYKAGLLPADKTNFIKQLQAQGKIVAMVGDGINDSAALAQSDVGIAMGKGSDIAIDTAKMTIISNDLTKISTAINLSKQTSRTIKENLFWAFIYNIIAIPIAAGILYPIDGFLLNPMIAGAAMAMSSVSVVSNSVILKYKKLK